jgi:acyl carrier protein
MADIKARVIKLVADKMDVDAAGITEETHFIDDLQSDSLDMAELVIDLEETFDVTISDEDAQTIETVGQAIVFIEANS